MSEGSRLTSPAGALEPEPRRVAAHAARERRGTVLLTNDAGEHALLSSEDYRRYLSGAVKDDEPVGKELLERQFLRDRLDFALLSERAADRFLLRWPGASVHTVVLTQRCNFKCAYCHASVLDESSAGGDMTPETARRVVDAIFRSPNPRLTIEFQGGEPLLNWPVLKFVVEYARRKNRRHERDLRFGLVSNFSLLDEEKADWLIERGVSFCTSLDGPAAVHDRNRRWLGGSGHAVTVEKLRMLLAKRAAGAGMDLPNAICTVTRHSLPHAREIVDQAVGLGLERVQVGPLDPIGFARKAWDAIGVSPEEFARFYGEVLDRLIELNKQGAAAYEKMAMILLLRVLGKEHWRFPNADGVARLAYHWDGSVYTGEDARLLASDGDASFRIGHVESSSHDELLEHPALRVALLAASPLSQPMCAQCAYSPFCTVQPVHNLATQGSPWGRMPENAWCRTMMGVFDAIFDRLADPGSRPVLESWLRYKDS